MCHLLLAQMKLVGAESLEVLDGWDAVAGDEYGVFVEAYEQYGPAMRLESQKSLSCDVFFVVYWCARCPPAHLPTCPLPSLPAPLSYPLLS